METLKIEGVAVEFPFVPYDCQVVYMQRVIQCLQQKSNAILESPTGTGKTLCLLCSCLAWRQSYVASHELEKCLGNNMPENKFASSISEQLKEAAGAWQGSAGGILATFPKIIYASRTHSQLSQVIQELKHTSYRPKVCVLGSREQMCIHPQVMKQESNTAKVHMCRAKVTSRTCFYYNNIENKKADKDFNDSILDIEDLVKMGHKHKCCPYYTAKELHSAADIIFMPYNYLLDPKSRKANGIDLNGNVIIFDEAHNVEKLCEESASFDLSSVELASCIQEVGALLDKVVESEHAPKTFSAEGDSGEDFDTTALAVLKALFVNLELTLQKICESGGEKGVTKPGSFILELLSEIHVTMDTKDELLELIDKIVSHLTNLQGGFYNKVAALSKFNDILNIVFSSQFVSSTGTNDGSLCYKVHIRPCAPDEKKKSTVDFWANRNGSAQKKGFIFSYWCFSPGFSMKELVAQGVRSIILTSGTLSPLNSFKSEMQIDFPIQLENPHVIEKHQMKVAVVTKGADGTELNSSYRTRFNVSYIASLGNTIINFCRVVPHGVLVFFPSYPVMNSCIENWRENRILSRMEQYKELFIEPRGKNDFLEAMNGFYSKVKDQTLNGAVFFAVCRGKVSEGLDFANNNGRAVLITGLPFPPRMDPKVVLKMQYLDEVKRNNQLMLSGHQWYRQQASRAVNQAIGRVIRHKEDYGAIVLCDVRFTHAEARTQLPSWVRPYVTVYGNFGQAFKDINSFFKVAVEKLPKPVPKKLLPPPHVSTVSTVPQHQHKPTSHKSTKSLVKANKMVPHVPSLKNEEVSDGQLHVMYQGARAFPNTKAQGLLSALNQAEVSNTSRAEAGDCSSWFDSKNETPKKSVETKKRKKIVIVKKSEVSSSKEAQSRPSVNTAQNYIQRDEDFSELVSTLATLFLNSQSEFILFRDFYRFVRPHHKKEFSEVCFNLTALSCNYKPEHSISKVKEDAKDGNLEKKRRLDNNQQIQTNLTKKTHYQGITEAK
ncbi:regulator of telomere elongation helicase 1-like isoform X2 [Antedon mediterranea]|uniref:regulator of telomere elongation helicase 1-like isoform X2 n=1 Tax=Antedon mediterranea TaxID=105859 RepID=UPI003AF84869